MAEKECIIQRIKKLLNLTVDRGATQDEAATAAAKAQALLLEHNLELSEIEGISLDKDDVLREDSTLANGNSPYAIPLAGLFHVLAKWNFCKAVYLTSGRAALVGKKHNAEVVKYLFDYLSKALIVEAERQHKAENRYENIRTWKACFIKGAASAISERLREQRKQQEAANQKTTALVVVQDGLVKRKVEEYWPKLSKVRSATRSSDAYNAGAAHGRTIPLNAGVNTGRRASVSIG